MKLPFTKTIRDRITLLIGALVLAATVNAILIIINAARFQQQMAELQNYTMMVERHTLAQTSLLKQQIALKNMLISEEDRAKDYGEAFRHDNALIDYLNLLMMQGEVDDETLNLGASASNFEDQVSAFYGMLYDESIPFEETEILNLEQVDPAAAELEEQMRLLSARDLQSIRDKIIEIETSTQRDALFGQIALLILAGLIVWGMFTTFDISRPIGGLTSAVVAFENNTYHPNLLAKYTQRPDELGRLAKAVGEMAETISESNRIKEVFLQAAQRFIPSQYLDFLEKDSITNVHLGDHVNAEMAVMFSDIRGFTTLSEKMTAKENFDFVNEYLKLVSPIIQEHDGFIVKFLGDGMMAIFPYGVADAVQAGIEKQLKVQEFNRMLKTRGLPEITVGIGIHTGQMMVGMIGEELRMQGDAFSDNVNLTARIEGLNKFYGTSMIISEDTLQEIAQPVGFKLRYLGKVVVKGRLAPLGMYEVYDGLPESVIEIKEATRADFEQGITLFAKGSFMEAGKLFDQVLQKDPSDKTARYYLESCAECASRPLPADWSGAIIMDSK